MPLTIGGKVVDGPKQGLLVLPREPEDIVFKFIAITNTDAFDKLCPMPVAPRQHNVKLNRIIDNIEDPNYKQQMIRQATLREDWYFINSIEPSKIEWQKVKLDDISTYGLWRDELTEAGFSVAETNSIWAKFLEINTLSNSMLDEARNRFLASQAEATLLAQQ